MISESLQIQDQEFQERSSAIACRVRELEVTNQETYDVAVSLLIDQIKPFRKLCKEYFDSMKEPAYKAYRAVLDRYNEADAPLEQAEAQIKFALAVWSTEQERKRQELQRQAELEARRVEEESRANAAAVAEETGATEEEVAEIVNAPSEAVAAPATVYVKAAGISTRENYKARVTDLKKLALAVAKGQVPVSYIEANMTALNARAKADKLTMNVPGVVAYNDPIVAGRTRG